MACTAPYTPPTDRHHALAAVLPLSAALVGSPAAGRGCRRPANYGSCVAYEAMFGDEPVREFTQLTTPLTAFFDDDRIRVVGAARARPGEDAIGCKPAA